MSKKAKNAQREKRKSEKKARKESMQRLYQQWANEGRNTKSKRVRLAAARGVRVRPRKGEGHPCTNVGCPQCQPGANLPFLAHQMLHGGEHGTKTRGRHKAAVREYIQTHEIEKHMIRNHPRK